MRTNSVRIGDESDSLADSYKLSLPSSAAGAYVCVCVCVCVCTGTLAMANSGKNTNTSQFYITFGGAADLSKLDGKHVVFGKVRVLSAVYLCVDETENKNPEIISFFFLSFFREFVSS